MINNIKKSKEGITLIALIVTIIVLLILAGITISTLMGENGLLTKAGEAKTRTEESSAYEQLDLVRADWSMERTINPDADLTTFLSEQKTMGKIDDFSSDGAGNYTITKNGYQREMNTIVFYIYHSSNNTVETIEMIGDGEFNLYSHCNANYLYGGYYSDYEGKGSYAGDGVEIKDGTEIAYRGGNATWVSANAYKENGMRMHPENGVTYYIKEVPKGYSRINFNHVVSGENQRIDHEIIISPIDDLRYKEVGFMINDTDRISLTSVNNSVTISGANTEVISAQSYFGLNGYIGWYYVDDYVVENTTATYYSYWVTEDGIFVKGASKKMVEYGNCNLLGEGCTVISAVNND